MIYSTPLFALHSTNQQRPAALAQPVDLVIIALYFVMVLGIGFYLKRFTKTGEDFFLAGRDMTAWVAGLSFVAANLGSLELMGWAGSAYQYGILATHWYWIGAIPAMLFLGIVMMPFYYISRTHSVPGYLKLRFGEPSRALSAVTFGFMTVLMSGINMYSMALVHEDHAGLGHQFSIWVSSLTVAAYVFLGGLLSAIFNEVLQFVLIWLGALLISILGLIEAGGWNGMVAPHSRTTWPGPGLHPSVEHPRLLHRQSDGHPLDRHRASGSASSFRSATGPPISWSCSASSPPKICAAPRWRPSSAPRSRWRCRSSSSCPGLLAWPCSPNIWSAKRKPSHRRAQL